MSTAAPDEVIVIHPPFRGEAHPAANGRDDQIPTIVLTPPPPAPVVREAIAPGTRAYGVDAYRGFFLLLMTFAMTIPLREGFFAEWMYHMQYPAPGQFVDRAGLTWRDLLFPAFLFTMCAAIPITNTLRLSKGMPYPAILWTAVKRFVVLYLFALMIGHALPYWTQDYTRRGNLIAIAGFLACWPLFMRRPPTWKQASFDRFKTAGWLAGAIVLLVLPLTYDSSFSLARKDGIIHALAFVSLVTTTLWLFTRNHLPARLAVLGVVIALKIVSEFNLPGSQILYSIEAPVMFQAWMVELLIVAIPASIAGDLLVRWMGIRESDDVLGWTPARLGALGALCLALVVTALVGFYLRYSSQTALALAGLSGVGLFIVAGARAQREKILATLFRGAAVLLVAGAVIEALGSGIKKDPQTLSYLVVTAGTSLAMLIIALVAADVLKFGRRITRLLVDVGQNPLIAYVAFTMFFNNIAWLLIFPYWQAATPSQAIVVSLAFTAATAALAVAATRKRIFWRA
jgi:predicted acyltransferase